MESEIKQNIELTKKKLTGEEKYLIQVNKLLDDAIKLIDNELNKDEPKEKYERQPKNVIQSDQPKKKRIQKNYYIKKKPEDKLKRGPKAGGWEWSKKQYTLERKVSENGKDKWVHVGDYSSYPQLWSGIKTVYPKAPYSCVKYFCSGKGN